MQDDFLQQYEILYKKADTDLKIAEIASQIDEKDFDFSVVFFHLQQAVEKYLKVLLAYNGIHFEKVHDISLLIDSCREHALTMPEYIDSFIGLNPYAVEGRYGFIVHDQAEDVDRYIDLLKKLKQFVERAISMDTA